MGIEAGIAAAEEPKKVLIIDDELGPAQFSQLLEDLRRELRDTNSPTFEHAWTQGQLLGVVPALNTLDADQIPGHVETERFVNEIVLSQALYDAVQPNIQAMLDFTRERRARADKLLTATRTAFPEPTFSVSSLTERPKQFADLLQYSFLVIDLVMTDNPPIKEVNEFLKGLSSQAGDGQPIPPLLLVSNLAEPLQRHRNAFRVAASISATGLCIQSKQAILAQDFGAPGLSLLFNRMESEKDVAQKMRLLGRRWRTAAQKAEEATAITLWNLDAAALQQIHLSAVIDHDPFVGHLLELITRDHEWQLEGDADFHAVIKDVAEQFDAEILLNDKKRPSLKRLYRTHDKSDMAALRDLEKHYWWMPSEVTPNFGDIDVTKEKATLSDDLPFGTVVTSNSEDNLSECYIHITQPCDLGKPDAVAKQKSLLFVRAELVRAPNLGTSKDAPIHAPGPTHNGIDYEMIIRKDQLIALPAQIVLKRCKNQRLWPLGRFRAHVARQVLNAVSDWSTRLDAILATKHKTVEARIAIKYQGSGGAMTQWYPHEVHMTSFEEKGKLWYLLDEVQWRFPLWCTQQMNRADVTADQLAGVLLSGVEKVGDGGKANGRLMFHVKSATTASSETVVNNIAIQNDKAVIAFILLDSETPPAADQPGAVAI